MSLEGVLSLYGAALATILALAQFIAWLRRRVNLEVVTGITRGAVDEGERESSKGTPICVRRDDSDLWEEALVAIEIRNRGGTPVQIVGVLVEFIEDGKLSSFQVIPEPLPSVLQPVTRIECSIQKEFLDFAPAIVFFGVVDELGRRFAPARSESVAVISASWKLPTRVGNYRRRDGKDGETVSAFQMKDRAQMSTPRPAGRRARPFIVKNEG